MMLTAVRRLCGQPETGPRGEDDQSKERISAPISPPPARQSRPSRVAVRELTARPALVNSKSGRDMTDPFLQEKTSKIPGRRSGALDEAPRVNALGWGHAAYSKNWKQKSSRSGACLNAAAAVRSVRSRTPAPREGRAGRGPGRARRRPPPRSRCAG